MFALVRWCAEPITQQCRLKVKVTIEGHQFEPWILRPLHCHSAAGNIAVLQTALLYLTLIMHWFSVHFVSRTLFRIFWWYLVVMKNRTRRHVTYKNDNFGFFFFYFWSYIPFLCLNLMSLVCNMNTLQNILMMLGTNVEQDEMTCWYKNDNSGRIGEGWWGGGGDICFFFLKNLF